MTLLELRFLHAYNAWATNRLFDALSPVPDEQYRRDMKGSHGSIHATLTHMVGAEKIWLERWQGVPTGPFLKPEAVGSLADLKQLWEKIGHDTAQWLGGMNDKKLQEFFTMKTLKGESFTHQYWQAFQHLINHSTFHRGQIVTMMRQLGATPPVTDLIVFYRETAKK
jgi:uncharacterized damage-inducible protein DinB